jgi:hypothetical protein
MSRVTILAFPDYSDRLPAFRTDAIFLAFCDGFVYGQRFFIEQGGMKHDFFPKTERLFVT